MIYVDPDELSSNSKFPKDLDVIPRLNLEQETGADFVVCTLPIDPITALDWHLENGSLFVQRKSAYDVLQFDNLKRSVSRMKSKGIRQGKCILLYIGEFDRGADGGLVINRSTASFSDKSYELFEEVLSLWELRGGITRHLLSEDLIGDWVKAQLRAMEKVKKEGDRQVYPENEPMYHEDEGDFQSIEEIPRDDLRSVLCRGLPQFGPKLAQSVVDYLEANKMPKTLFYALLVLSGVNEKDKPLHKISGFGAKKHQQIRQIVGLNKGANLQTSQVGQSIGGDINLRFVEGDYGRGWFAALDQMLDIAKSRKQRGEQISFLEMIEMVRRYALEFYIDE